MWLSGARRVAVGGRLAAQPAEVIVDKEALDRRQFAAEGGFARVSKVVEGKLQTVLRDMGEVWASPLRKDGS